MLSPRRFFNSRGGFMLVPCPSCAKKLNVPDSAAGKKVKCPGCTKIFEVARAGVQAAPAPGRKPPPAEPADEVEDRPRRPSADDEVEERPRGQRRSPAAEDDEPRGRRRSRDDDADEDLDELEEVDERPARRRAGNAHALGAAVSRWLRIGSYMLLGYYALSLAFGYLMTTMLQDVVRAAHPGQRLAFAGAGPLFVLLVGLAVGTVILGPCLTFMFLGASRASQLRGRGLVFTGLIIAVVLGVLGVLVVVGNLLQVLALPNIFSIVRLVLSVGTAAVLLFGGIRGLVLMSQPALREAFAANSGSRRRGRDRYEDDDDDDEEEDEERSSRRRRRSRDDDD